MANTIYKPGFQIGWNECQNKNFKRHDESDTKHVELRKWQQEYFQVAIDAYKKKKHVLCIAPTGAGKSKGIQYTSLSFAAFNPQDKIIISVPSLGIGEGFRDFVDISLDKKNKSTKMKWDLPSVNNICDGTSEGSKTKALANFITKPNIPAIQYHISTCSHATLLNAFSYLKEIGHDFRGIRLFLDECHHGSISDSDQNRLGELINFFCENSHKDLTLHPFTATPFRGDRNDIMPAKYKDDFVEYQLPYDRHFTENCNNLQFNVKFALSEKSPWVGIEDIIGRNPSKKTILFVPQTGSRYALPSKAATLQAALDSISGVKGYVCNPDADGIFNVKRGGKVLRFVDLVDDEDIGHRNSLLRYIKANPEKIDYVLGMKVPKEGFDWPPASRIIMIGHKESMNEYIQMIGRAFRQHGTKDDGKEVVEIFQVFPWVDFNSKKLGSDEELTGVFNNYIKAVFSSLIYELHFAPVDLKIPSVKKAMKKHGLKSSNDVRNWAIGQLGESGFQNLIEDCFERIGEFKLNNPDFKGTKKEYKEKYKEILAPIVCDKLMESEDIEDSDEDIEERSEVLCDMLIGICEKRTKIVLPDSGIDLSEIEVDLVEKVDAKDLDDPFRFFVETGNVGSTNLDTWRELVGENEIRWIIMFEKCNSFFKHNNKIANERSSDINEKNIGRWIFRQKRRYKTNIILDSQIKKLESLSWWAWNEDKDKEWEEKFNYLVNFYNKNKMLPNRRSKNNEERISSNWTNSQRANYKNGILSKYRESKLNNLNWWKWESDLEEQWNDNLNELIDFYSISKKIPSKNESKFIASWVSRQRNDYKTKNLSLEKTKKLESFDWWEWTPIEEKWKENYEKIKLFISINNRYPSVYSEDKEEGLIGSFMSNQKRRKNKLSKEKMALFEALPNWIWEIDRDKIWEEELNRCNEFYLKYNKIPHKRLKCPIAKKLGFWIQRQKSHYNNPRSDRSKMDHNKIKKLESYSWWKWSRDA